MSMMQLGSGADERMLSDDWVHHRSAVALATGCR